VIRQRAFMAIPSFVVFLRSAAELNSELGIRNSECSHPPPYPRNWAVVLGLVVCLLIPVLGQAVESGEVVIAVVRDGPPSGQDIVPMIEEELALHLPRGTVARFTMGPAFDAGWDPQRIESALTKALGDPESDLVLVTGSLGTVAAAGMELNKPVVSSFLQRADLYPLPFADEDRSPLDNMVFMVQSQRAARDVEVFRSLAVFDTLAVLVGAEDVPLLGMAEPRLDGAPEMTGLQLEVVAVSPDTDATLANLPADIEAAYLTALPRLSPSARQALIDGLTEKGIVTFSMLGHPDVEAGAFAGLTPDTRQQIVRRVALNLSRLIRGEGAADLPVLVRTDSKLLINARTAAELALPISPQTRILASFLYEEVLEKHADPLTFADTLTMAVEQNTLLSIQDAVTASAQENIDIAKSNLLPQVGLDLSALGTDAEIAFTNAGVSSDGSVRGALALRQMIYDDRSVSNYKSAKKAASSSEFDLETVRLEVLADAGRAYVNLALAEAVLEVERSNLQLSEDNLELAILREEVGYSGRDEVLRWQAVVADGRSAVLLGEQGVEVARIELNQILNVDQSRRWTLEETPVDPDSFTFLDGRLATVFGKPGTWTAIRTGFSGVAQENSPEIGALDELFGAQQIQVNRAKRAWFLPSFSAGASYSDEIVKGDTAIAGFGNDFYKITIDLSYPVFEGGRKGSESAKSKILLEGIERELDLAHQFVERRTRTSLRRVESSFPRIRFSEQAAEAATASLVIVQDKYAEGIVNITDLLSAQTGKFTSDRLVVVSVHEFLLDLIELQRALSWFEAEKTAGERAALADRVLAAAEVE
jgi:outer membrane protein